jgi:hypothetical protein
MPETNDCMTGDEFVATWNELFRLRDNNQGPDTCLDKPAFIETVSDSINQNATRMSSTQVVHQAQPVFYQPQPQPVQYINTPARSVHHQPVLYTPSHPQFQNVPVTYTQPQQVVVDVRNEVNNLFHDFDKDRSGFLERNEILNLLDAILAKQGRPKATWNQFNNHMNAFDNNGDGRISRDECANFIQDWFNRV